MGSAKTTKNLGSTLRPVAGTYRRRIKALYLARTTETALNDERRLLLEGCIFEVQNDLEHRSPTHPQVAIMNAVRNVLLDDVPVELGGQREPTTNPTRDALRWPHVEAMARRIASGRGRRQRVDLEEAA